MRARLCPARAAELCFEQGGDEAAGLELALIPAHTVPGITSLFQLPGSSWDWYQCTPGSPSRILILWDVSRLSGGKVIPCCLPLITSLFQPQCLSLPELGRCWGGWVRSCPEQGLGRSPSKPRC